jgi:very-short-patch-repair endonuclease
MAVAVIAIYRTPAVKSLLLFFAVVAICLALPVLLRGLAHERRNEVDWPFSAKKPLSRVEQVLYYRLVQTLPDLTVLAQVPMSSFLRVRKGRTWNEWFNRISRKSVDFLVCERDFTIVMAVELDDATHDEPGREMSDKTKTRALTAAGVPLIRWRAHALPDVATIRRIVDDIRDYDGQLDAAVVARIEPALHVSRVEASNDPSIFHEEKRS